MPGEGSTAARPAYNIPPHVVAPVAPEALADVRCKGKAAMIPISKMAGGVQPSATLAAGAKARQLKAQGVHVYDFSLGEPDFLTPDHICHAALKAMKDGHTHYTPAAGIAELRTAITRYYQKTYGLEVSPEQVIVSN